MVLRLISSALMALAFSGGALAQPCSQQEAQQAETTAATLTSWPKVHAFYLRYRHCDDGAIAEGLTESVMKMLANEWPSASLVRLASAEPAFKAFVLLHINASGAEGDLAAIESNASKRCPASQKSLCKEIVGAVRAAQADLDSSPNRQHTIDR